MWASQYEEDTRPVQHYEDGEGSRGQDVGGAADVPWFVQPRKEKMERRPDCSEGSPGMTRRGG